MKTTVEISDALLDEARRAAARERTTVRALIEEGLRKVIKDRRRTFIPGSEIARLSRVAA